jgi:predicted AlkP superfamily pyrophosphatase or phosphodiesterase
MLLKMNNKRAIFPAALWLLLTPLCGLPASGPSAAPADLVLLVVIDQLRGDMPWRFRDRFGAGGFRYLMEQGTSFSNAQYQHANTLTASGHATLATGGNSPQHGLAGNDWFDAATRRAVYCMEDPGHPQMGGGAGRSPRNLMSSTFGGELVLASGGKSRVFSVSLKDRSAIILGGRLGKAYWYSQTDGAFVTSSYYHEAEPEWMRRWNDAKPAERFMDTSWELLQEPDRYVYADQDERSYEQPPAALGRTFPHALARADHAGFFSNLRETPMADELTLEFVRALVAAERPGLRGETDVLAISFSATDYIGHSFGPNSLEAEDNLLRLDQTLAALLRLVDSEVGLERTLVVLTSDHGTAPIPEYMAERGFEAGRHDAPRFMGQVNEGLKRRFGTERELALAFWNPGIYLDLAAIGELGLDVAAVERAVAEEILRIPGFALAFTRSDLLAGRYPSTPEATRVASAFHANRSGNVLVVPSAFWYLEKEPDGNAAMHGSLYRYDTHVPLMLAGPGVGRRVVLREVAPRDLAPTLSAYLGIAPPSGSVGVLLEEVWE